MSREEIAFVTQEEASRVWRRAIELQREATRRLEAHDRLPAHVAEGTPADEHFTLDEVRVAAEEVGIEAEHLRLALAELKAQRAGLAPPARDAIDRLAARFLGGPPAALDVNKVIRAPVHDVYDAMQRVFPAPPFRLRLREFHGSDPLDDGILVFDVLPTPGGERTYGAEVLMAEGRLNRLYVTLRPLREAEGASRVSIRAPVVADHEGPFWIGSMATGAAAGGGAALGGASAGGFGILGMAALLPAGVVAFLAGGGTLALIRFRYLRHFHRSVEAMEELLEVLDVTVRTGGAFAPLAADELGGRGGISFPPEGTGGR